MKVKVNLYNRNPKGRIDTFQFAPHTRVDRERKTKLAYSVNYTQACLLLQAIQVNGRRRLSTECILQLASFVAKSWELDPTQEKIGQLTKLMNNLLDTTLLCPESSLDDALKQFCQNKIPTHSVSPTITLLIAISYIERLKQKYRDIKGTSGCGNRLILVAYMMAAKYMHINLKSLINVPSTQSDDTSEDTLPTIQTLPSPPTSPPLHSDTDPLKYHYFPPSYNSEEKRPESREYHYQIMRMELEFLHFLDYDLSIENAFRLIRWAQKFDDMLLPPIRNQSEYTATNNEEGSK